MSRGSIVNSIVIFSAQAKDRVKKRVENDRFSSGNETKEERERLRRSTSRRLRIKIPENGMEYIIEEVDENNIVVKDETYC